MHHNSLHPSAEDPPGLDTGKASEPHESGRQNISFAEQAARLGKSEEYAALVAIVADPSFRQHLGEMVMRYTAFGSDRDDHVQDACIKLLGATNSITNGRLPGSYTRVVVHRVVIDHWRHTTNR